MEDFSPLAAAPEAAVVLQAADGGPCAPLGFRADGERLCVDQRSVEHHVVAGALAALLGLVPPFRTWTPGAGGGGPGAAAGFADDWLWAAGAQPFGPVGSDGPLSLLLVDAARRNAVVSRVDGCFRVVRGVLERVAAFAAAYLSVASPAGPGRVLAPEEVEERGASVLELLFTDRDAGPAAAGGPALPHRLVPEVRAGLAAYERDLGQIKGALLESDLDGAFALASTVLQDAEAFRAKVEAALEAAELDLSCCSYQHAPPRTAPGPGGALALAAALAAAVAAFRARVGGSRPSRPARQYP